MSDEFRILLVLLLSALPGLLGMLCCPTVRCGSGVAVAFGWACILVVSYLLAWAGLLRLFPWFFVTALVCLLGLCVKQRLRLSGTGAVPAFRLSASTLLFAFTAGLYVSAVLTLSWSPGWDPSFHCLLAGKILRNGALSATWLPFENVPVNYPQGLHAVIAVIADLAGTPVEAVFRVFHAAVQLVAVCLVYDLARVFTGSRRSALLAMASYGLLAGWGSFFSYVSWGGLPTELAAVFWLALIRLVYAEPPPRTWLAGIVLCGAIAMTHHLSAAIVAWVIVFHAARDVFRGKLGGLPRRLLGAGLGAALCFSPLLVRMLLSARGVATTHVFAFTEEPMQTPWGIVHSLGIVFTVVSVVGTVVIWRRSPRSRAHFLWSWLGALIGAYILLDVVYRGLAVLFAGRNVTALTPSRWLTVMAYPLAICAGRGWSALIASISAAAAGNVGQRRKRRIRRWVLRAALAVCVAVGCVRWLRLVRSRPLSDVTVRGAATVGAETPPSALVIYVGFPADLHWMPYLTWRASLITPLPASENRSAMAEKQAFLSNPENLSRLGEWFNAHGYTGYVCVYHPDTDRFDLIPYE